MVYPHLIAREFFAFGLLFALLILAGTLFDAPLEELANPGKTPNPAKAPWYFLSLQELLHYSPPLIAGWVVPFLLVVTVCALPYFKGRMLLIPVGFLVCIVLLPMLDGVLWSLIHSSFPRFAEATRDFGLPTFVLLTVAFFGLCKLALSKAMDDEKRASALSKRLFLAFLTILMCQVFIGQYCRGPEWRWMWPWQ